MRNTGGITLLAVGSLLLLGCDKSTPATADSATVSSTSAGSFDENAARAQILSGDSAFMRGMLAKNVDSAMMPFDSDVVQLGTGKIVNGIQEMRAFYTEAVKANPRDATMKTGGVRFSNDHSVAWDYGTYTQTTDMPNGKPAKSKGTYLNVWKNVGGRWVIVAATSSAE